jgi:hypothetical protein
MGAARRALSKGRRRVLYDRDQVTAADRETRRCAVHDQTVGAVQRVLASREIQNGFDFDTREPSDG